MCAHLHPLCTRLLYDDITFFSLCLFLGLLSDSRAQIVHCFPSVVSSQERNIQAKFCIKPYLWCSFNAGVQLIFLC